MAIDGEIPEVSQWKRLHDHGVILKDTEIDFITNGIVDGSNEALKFLGQSDYEWPKIIFSDDMDTIGYVPRQQVINIPVQYLNKMAAVKNPFSDHQQIVYTIAGKEISIPYSQYLKLAGREETVHHFQEVGHPSLKAKYSAISPAELSQVDRLLCDIEVEARKTVDAISIKLGEQPIWANFDTYLSQQYPDRYNKPVDHLISIQSSH